MMAWDLLQWMTTEIEKGEREVSAQQAEDTSEKRKVAAQTFNNESAIVLHAHSLLA